MVEAVVSGASRREAAELFEIPASTAVKWLQRLRETGSAAAKPRGGSTSPLEEHAAVILALIEERSDATLAARQIKSSRGALWRFFARHRITRKKKSLRAAEQKRADVARARRRWIREQGLLDPARLVHIVCSHRCSQRLRRDDRRRALEGAATFQCDGDTGLRT